MTTAGSNPFSTRNIRSAKPFCAWLELRAKAANNSNTNNKILFCMIAPSSDGIYFAHNREKQEAQGDYLYTGYFGFFGATAGIFFNPSSAIRTAFSNCGSWPARTAAGVISTSTSGATPL